MLDLGSGVAGVACGWVAGRAGLRLWVVPPNWVWVGGTNPHILEHPTSICNTGVIFFTSEILAQHYPEMGRLLFSYPSAGLVYMQMQLYLHFHQMDSLFS